MIDEENAGAWDYWCKSATAAIDRALRDTAQKRLLRKLVEEVAAEGPPPFTISTEKDKLNG